MTASLKSCGPRPTAIGYVELAQALRSNLSFALIQNSAKKFIKPEPATFQAAAGKRGLGGRRRFRSGPRQCARRAVLSDHGDSVRADEQEFVANAARRQR